MKIWQQWGVSPYVLSALEAESALKKGSRTPIGFMR